MGVDIFEEMKKSNSEQIIFNYDKDSGMKSIIVIHDTTIGPAMGGCRMLDYASTDEALLDAIRLAKGMTYKCALSGENHGGGKSVIIGNPETEKNEILFRDLGRFVDTLNGRYYVGTDVGTNAYDMVYASQESNYVVGLPEEYGGYGDSGKPTAYGVYMAMRASAKFAYGNDSLSDLTVAIQGVGSVGSALVDYLAQEGTKIIISNRNKNKIKNLKSKYPDLIVVENDEIYEQECDIFAPCALGGIINDETIAKLRCKIIAGSANNQLSEPRHGQALLDRGILFAPDFVINTGGFISASDTLGMKNVNQDRVMHKIERIYNTLLDIYTTSKEKNIQTPEIAYELARLRMEKVAKVKRKYVSP